MRLEELDYQLPDELIARAPAEPRDHSRLLHLSRTTGELGHTRFHELPRFLRKGDCVVLNDTRVIPACFFCNRATGGKVEGLFLRQVAQDWHVLLKPGGRLRVGETLTSAGRGPGNHRLTLRERLDRGAWRVTPEGPPVDAFRILEEIGRPPLPPYIRAGRRAKGAAEVSATDTPHYQTVYARTPGAVAAPTAGLHFTPQLFDRLRSDGIQTRFVTLHVGLGTFEPLEAEQIEAQRLHSEWYEIRADTIAALQATRAAGGRIVAVGTTSCRVLESFARGRDWAQPVHAVDTSGWTDLFIYPPYEFAIVDALITNFHLSRSSLLALVMAFAGTERTRTAYAEAIARGYRFYSYGDAMLIS